MKKVYPCVLAAFTAVSALASPPKATVTEFSQDPDSGTVSVSYTVDGDCIVTAEFLSSGEPIACEKYADRLVGTINREVGSGKTHVFRWAPDSSGDGIDFSGKSLEVRLTAWDPLSPPPYMALDITVTNNVAYYASSNAVPGGVHDFRYKSDFLLMRRIPAKNVKWTMGVSESSKAWNRWTKPGLRKVTLTYDYYIGVFAVTQRQHERLTAGRPSMISSETPVGGIPAYMGRPVEQVSYDSIRGSDKGSAWPEGDFAEAHAVDAGSVVHSVRAVTGRFLDLPSEAEWEFACRAGCPADVYTGKWITTDADRISTGHHGLVARCHQNSGYDREGFSKTSVLPDEGGTAVVGSYEPNRFGLYDMLGNVREWCLDWYDVGIQDITVHEVDYRGPKRPADSPRRVIKGGAYIDSAYICTAGDVETTYSDTATNWPNGYRLCLIIK